jgi:hypothetical protein
MTLFPRVGKSAIFLKLSLLPFWPQKTALEIYPVRDPSSLLATVAPIHSLQAGSADEKPPSFLLETPSLSFYYFYVKLETQ